MRRTIGLMLVTALGVGIGVLSPALDWFAARDATAAVLHYTNDAVAIVPPQRDALLQAAISYNARLAAGQFDLATLEASREYQAQLRVPNSEALGYLQVPKLGIDLPIFRGTSDWSLNRGVGHEYGTSLPVGGPGTHAILAGHSGLVHAKMFTDLNQMTIGDTFTVTVLGQTRHYTVDQISVVEPEALDTLDLDPGKDWVTLATCTPTGINSHRLLVRGVRTYAELAPTDEAGLPSLALTGPGFPWWAAAWLGAVVLVGLLSRVRWRRRNQVECGTCGTRYRPRATPFEHGFGLARHPRTAAVWASA